jgi:hypothetical protein
LEPIEPEADHEGDGDDRYDDGPWEDENYDDVANHNLGT